MAKCWSCAIAATRFTKIPIPNSPTAITFDIRFWIFPESPPLAPPLFSPFVFTPPLPFVTYKRTNFQ